MRSPKRNRRRLLSWTMINAYETPENSFPVNQFFAVFRQPLRVPTAQCTLEPPHVARCISTSPEARRVAAPDGISNFRSGNAGTERIGRASCRERGWKYGDG